MKRTLTRIFILLTFAVVLSIYILYVLENLPSILQVSEAKNTSEKSQGQHSAVAAAEHGQMPYAADDADADDSRYDNTEVHNTEFGKGVSDEVKVHGTGSESTWQSGTGNGRTGPKNTVFDREVGVENDIWRAVNRSESYNGELQFYTQDNVILDDGRITIITKKEKMGSKNYTSGMVMSKYAYMYGFFSFRISVSEGKGLFPAIWLLPAEDKRLPEIDIFEMIGSEPLKFYGVLHYGSTAQAQRKYFCHEVPKKEFYEVGIKWTKEELSWYIDGQCVYQTDKDIPDEPMYLIVNQAVGGNWPGTPDDTTVFPARFIIESCILEPELSIEP